MAGWCDVVRLREWLYIEEHEQEYSKTIFSNEPALGVVAQSFDPSSAQRHIKAINDLIFPPGFKQAMGLFETPKGRQETQKELSRQHSRSAPEWIIFNGKNKKPVGWFYGYMEDEETFFIDTIGFIPEYRGVGIYRAFLPQLFDYLKAKGYERVTTSHHPNNRAALIADLKTGFNIVGMELHESLGPQVKMVHSLYEDRRKAFEQVFSMEAEKK